MPEPTHSTTPPIARFKIDGYELDLSRYLGRDYDDVTEASAELPAVHEWVNEKLQVYAEMLNTRKAELREAEAVAYFDLRKGAFDADYGGKQTEGALDKAVCLDKEVRALVREVAVLSGWCTRLRGIQEALGMKLDLVRSSEATRRQVFP